MSGPARAAARRTRSTILAALGIVGAALAGVLTWQSLPAPPAPSSSSVPSPVDSPPGVDPGTRGDRKGALGAAGGAVPDGVTVFDDRFPAVANLDPDLLEVLR